MAGRPLGPAQAHSGFGQDGGNRSPQLAWNGFPPETASFAVTCFDPDAVTGSGFWHWILVDIPADVHTLHEGAGSPERCPPGASHVRNDFGELAYGGAATRPGQAEHRYVFAVHALSQPTLGVDTDTSPAMVGARLGAFSIARARLVATSPDHR
ncbi:YbhB/YbcL family Raf kinase inhibitor-like protein [Micromonospora sp. DT233]|uniref:YbhB/YbcL family Raf kinase inhibitor-like protein n=1 Tax=Micromonospora sp. DT233 TaxID=3393432 RepID=UPI003CE83DAA